MPVGAAEDTLRVGAGHSQLLKKRGRFKGTGEIDVPFILDNKSKLSHFHIHDGREIPPKNHLALGDGEIDLIDRLNVAKACNARCVLETKTIKALKKSVEWIKNDGN